jgi:glutamine amidotransferase
MLVIVDYGMGNLGSVAKACRLYSSNVVISQQIEVVEQASRIILPGVGAFGDGMKSLNAAGLVDVIMEKAGQGTPILGICLGMQLLSRSSEESPGVKGLSLIESDVIKFDDRIGMKIPHVGWNSVHYHSSPLFKDVAQDSDFYFVHSFHISNDIAPELVLTKTDYKMDFVSAIRRENVIGVQFHPEKSQKVGLKFLENFINLPPEQLC